MRRMPPLHVAGFASLVLSWGGITVALALVLSRLAPQERLALFCLAFPPLWGAVGGVLLRLSMILFPLRPGEIPQNSRQEAIYHVAHLPFLFFLYYPLQFSGLIPVPFSGWGARLFGARLGSNTYPGRCMIFDPSFVTIGESTILGHQSALIPHVMEGTRLAHHPIRVGDNVTIGVNAVVLAGTTIGDDAVVAAGAVVPKFSRIGAGEVWGGIPARSIGRTDGDSTASTRLPAGASARFVAASVALLFAAVLPLAAAPNPTAEEVARLIYNRDTGRTMYSENDIILIDKTGAVQARVMIQASQKRDGLLKNYMRFTEPVAIAGTTFLSLEVADKEDEQFLYLPELGRDRRIVSSQRSASFMNTDFSFEDMERRHFLKDQHRLLGEAVVLGTPCWILESTTRPGEKSQYGRRVAWVGKTSHLPLKGEMYSRKNNRLLRRFEAKKIAQVDGVWTLMDVEMTHVEREHRTQWRVRKVAYNKNLNDRLFTRAYMKLTR